MKSLFAIAGLLAASMAQALSGVLIIQEQMPESRTTGDPNVPVANVLAEFIETEGLYAPVVWSYTDPIFRAAVSDGHIKAAENVPTLAQATEVAKKLRLDNIIYVRTYVKGNAVLGRIQLYRGNRLTWKDPEKVTEMPDPSFTPTPIRGVDKNGNPTVTIPKAPMVKMEDRPMTVSGPQGLNREDSASSLVRTWVELMKGGPLKGQPTQPKILTPEALPGTNTHVPEVVPKVKAKVDNKQLLSDLDAMVRSGQSIPAVLILRDAVDAEPQDVERRVALVRTLLLVGQPELAAKEARRAAQLIPDKIELRAMAARAWMQAGREDEAMADLNEAVARDPNSSETRYLLAEVNLSKLRPTQALEHLDALLKEKPTGDAWFKHALGETLLGRKEKAAADLVKAKEIGLPAGSQDVAVRYDATLDILDKSVMQLGMDLRNLYNLAQVKRTDSEVKELHRSYSALVDAWTAFLSANPAPNLHRSSHDRRILALNLLSQSLGELGNYLTTNDEGVFADSRINMGEALKQFTAAQTSYRNEIGGIAKGVGN